MIKNGITPRFIEVGKIKIGGKGEMKKSKEGKEFQLPIRYDHFVVTTTEKGKDGNYIPDHAIMKKLVEYCNGGDVREIPIRLPFDSIDMNFFTSFQYYHGNKCVCRGDGESAERTAQDGSIKKIKCDPDACEYLKNEKCKVSGILSCHIPLSMEVGGVYRFRTHSWNTVSGILASLKYFSDNTNGVLQGLPLKMKFLKKSTQDHGNVNVVTVVLDGIELMKMRELALVEYENRMKLGIDMKLLESQAREAGFTVETDDPEDVAAEWYPVETMTETEKRGPLSSNDVAEKITKPTPPVEPSADSGSLL